MNHSKSARTGLNLMAWLTVLAALTAAPAAQALVTTELSVSGRVFPNTSLGESAILGQSFGTKSLVAAGLPTTVASVEGNLSSGTLKAKALTDYFRADFDPTPASDFLTAASARVTISDTVTFANVPIGAVGYLDLQVNGNFSTVDNPRRIPSGTANASAQVNSADRSVLVVQQRWFAADAFSIGNLPQFARSEALVGSSATTLDTLAFDLHPGRYTFARELRVSGNGYDVDFGSTAHMYLRLPEGVTFTSESGVFLATAQPLLAVPWPPMRQLWLAGLGLLAAWMAYRQAYAARNRSEADSTDLRGLSPVGA